MEPEKQDPSDAGKSLRLLVLNTKPEALGFVTDADYPNIYGAITDWRVGDQVATIVALRDGTTSLYTTSTFGIIGGQAHESVRTEAALYIEAASALLPQSSPASEFPYPGPGDVNYYSLTYQGVRLAVGKESGIQSGSDPSRPVFAAAQNVLTQLHQTAQSKTPNARHP